LRRPSLHARRYLGATHEFAEIRADIEKMLQSPW
jgi:hypothetical protein